MCTRARVCVCMCVCLVDAIFGKVVRRYLICVGRRPCVARQLLSLESSMYAVDLFSVWLRLVFAFYFAFFCFFPIANLRGSIVVF